MATKYMSIPVEVEALHFDRSKLTELVLFTECETFSCSVKGGKYQYTVRVGGVSLLLMEGNYIVKSSNGEFSIMAEEAFNATYIKKE